MDVYGLTGGIGSGKSTVAELLEDYGVPVVSADELSRVVVAKGSDGLDAVVECFGPEVLDEHGELDRRRMAALVFEDPAKRRALESILHPRIRERFEQVLDALEKAGHEVTVYEVPLLFEKNLQGEMKAVVLVTADEDVRIERVTRRDDVTDAEVRARMATQLDEAVKRKRADYVIENNGTMDELRREVEFLLARFLRVEEGRRAANEPHEVPVQTGRTIPPGVTDNVRARTPTEIPDDASSQHRSASATQDAPSNQRTEIPAHAPNPTPAPSPRTRTLRVEPAGGPASPGELRATTPNIPPVPGIGAPPKLRREHSSPLPISPPGVPTPAQRRAVPPPPGPVPPSKPGARPAPPPPTPVPSPPTAPAQQAGDSGPPPSRRRTQTMPAPAVPSEPSESEDEAQ